MTRYERLTTEQKAARSAYGREYRRKNSEILNEKKRQKYAELSPEDKRLQAERHARWIEENIEHVKNYQKEWYQRDEDFRAKQLIEKRYNIAPGGYEAMLLAQGGHCALCPRTPEENGKRLGVDHDHVCCPGRDSCGKCVRGLVCQRHNLGLGYFDDDIAALEDAITYLKHHKRLLLDDLSKMK